MARAAIAVVPRALLPLLGAWSMAAGRAAAQASAYPPAHRDSVVEVHHGTPVADPYRWLEQPDSPATAAWVAAQGRLTESYLAGIPARDSIRRRLTGLWSFPRAEVPWREAGRIFFVEQRGDQPQPALYVQDAPEDAPRAVLDPGEISPDGSVAVGDYAVSPDGRWLAYSQSRGGGGGGETRVRDLATGRERGDVVRDALGAACWTFDGAGFLFVRPRPPVPGEAEHAARLEKQVLYHVLGQPPERDRLIGRWPEARWVYCMLSDDGRRAFLVEERGSAAWIFMMDLRDPRAPDLAAPLVPLLADQPRTTRPWARWATRCTSSPTGTRSGAA